ncbi:hypothetical protein DLM45_15300 [Hyphomicrobium methylovorum]|uniref:hypothetical protein n=1 Tax=Hyphomicrobium methylovorum TaxID=84 RepID=UPI0015E65142|nr:hypothetical protein [Hyphomicrobium methylovorum]MBA2127577.1 hypothetical protein [Hyphomicrobium methylovorum]
MSLVEEIAPHDIEALHREHSQKYRDARAEADKLHTFRRAEAERTFAHDVLSAYAKRREALRTVPSSWGCDGSGRTFAVGDPDAIEAAEAVYREAFRAAEIKRDGAIGIAREEHGRAIDTVRNTYRHSGGYLGETL